MRNSSKLGQSALKTPKKWRYLIILPIDAESNDDTQGAVGAECADDSWNLTSDLKSSPQKTPIYQFSANLNEFKKKSLLSGSLMYWARVWDPRGGQKMGFEFRTFLTYSLRKILTRIHHLLFLDVQSLRTSSSWKKSVTDVRTNVRTDNLRYFRALRPIFSFFENRN